MKTLRLFGAHDLRLLDEPTPTPAAGEVLLKVASVGICGSDSHWFSEGNIGGVPLTQPLVLGHEFTAVVASGDLRGKRVAVDPAIPCGKCEFCEEGNPNLCPSVRFAGTGTVDGALAEFISWPARNLFPLPDSVSNIEGALLEPLGVAMHALSLAPVRPGMTVGVYGCGPIGLLIVQLARLSGALRIFASDLREERLQAALDTGASEVFMADEHERDKVRAETRSRGVDVAFEVAGADEAVETAMVTCKPGGKVVIVGIPSEDHTTFTASVARKKGLTILMCRRMKHTYPRSIELVASGRVNLKNLVSHSFPFGEYQNAFLTAEKRNGIKVVIEVS
jgi:L-iditol 2-dehydrogenase